MLILRQNTLTQNLKVTKLGNINQRSRILGSPGLVFNILRDQRPELVDVDDGTVKLVAKFVEVTHTDLSEITRMVFVEKDSVVVHASSITATSGVLPVLADTTMPCAYVPSLLPVLLQTSRHFC